jgi:hypothetical protein
MTSVQPEHVVRADRKSRVPVEGHANEEFAVLRGPLGGILLVPLDHLSEGEQAVFRDPRFLRDTLAGIDDMVAGRIKPLDWVLDYAEK